jgi:hypothetical protein
VNDEPNIAIRRIDQQFITLRTAIRWGAGLVLAYLALEAIKSLAGVQTSVVVRAALSVVGSVHVVLPYGLAAGCAIWGASERKLRHRNTRYLQDRVIHLERDRDPNRTTSGLTRSGQTNPRDIVR